MFHARGDALSLKQLYPQSSPSQISFACKVHSSIQCHPLPSAVRRMQGEALWQMHSSCYRKHYSAHNITFCLLCAMNERGVRNKMRMSITTGETSCDSCPKGTVVTVNMLGVILKICNTSYYMCPCCTKIQVWRGDGLDLCNILQTLDREDDRANLRATLYRSEGPCACDIIGGGSSSSDYSSNSVGVVDCGIQTRPASYDGELPRCMVCNAKNSRKPFTVLPDLRRKIMVRCYLCVRHSIPEHVKCMVSNTEELEKALSFVLSSSSSKRKRMFKKSLKV